MVLALEREGSLTDLRRTQRRVAALLLSDTHVELLKFPLRKRIVPQGFCYVCSRLDPSGIFKKPNSYLYKKGFFQTCEHFPKAPYTTFVHDEVTLNDRKESLNEPGTNKTETISVTIRRGSRSSKFPSPVKKESTYDSLTSRVERFDKDQISSRESLLQLRSKISDGTTEKLTLPPITTEAEIRLGTRSSAKTTSKISEPILASTASGANTGLSRKSLLHSETISAGRDVDSIPASIGELVTVIPTAFDRTSAISELSIFSEGTTPTKSTNDLDSKFESEAATIKQSAKSKHSFTTGKISASRSSRITDPLPFPRNAYPTGYATEPLAIREVGESVRRPKAGHYRERLLIDRYSFPSEEKSASTQRPESGHLRYHHRMSDDSVPYPGFDIPPTPSEELLQELEKLQVDEDDTGEVGFSKCNLTSTVSDDASIALSEKTGKSAKTSSLHSERHNFCRCATDLREVSFTRNVCRTCGKDCRLNSRGSSQTMSQIADGKQSVKSKSSRQKMLQRDDARMNIRSKPFTDEDYMDLDSILHEDDGRYWTSDEEFAVEQSPISWYRYKHAQPYPLVDPDIHKLVYLKALQAAKMKGKRTAEDFEIDELELLRRPNVFSYIPLLPQSDKNNTKYIGIRPDDSDKPKKSQFMKHIFGEVKLDDFYPGHDPRRQGRLIIDGSTNFSSTEQSSTERSDNTKTKTASKDHERSSVSIKMRKQGRISFDHET